MSVGFSTNSKMEQIAMNDLKNQAAKLGANYVRCLPTVRAVTIRSKLMSPTPAKLISALGVTNLRFP